MSVYVPKKPNVEVNPHLLEQIRRHQNSSMMAAEYKKKRIIKKLDMENASKIFKYESLLKRADKKLA